MAPAVKLTVAWASPAVAVPMVGAAGTVAGVTFTVADGALLPTLLVATNEQLYVVPFVRPVTVIGEVAPLAESRLLGKKKGKGAE